MIDKLKIIFTSIFILTVTLLRGQYGEFELRLNLPDKEASKIINDSILSSLKRNSSIAFETSNFYVPMDPADKQNRIQGNNLFKKDLVGLKVAIEWDAQKNEAIILGYAPMYSFTPIPPFFLAGNFKKIFSEQHYMSIKTGVQNALLREINNSNVKPKEDKSTIRQINTADFNCIYHIEFSYLPQYLLAQWKSGVLILFEDHQLTVPIDHSQDLLDFAEEIKTLCLYEQWSDTTIVNEGFGPNPLPFDTDYIKRKSVALGLMLPTGKVVWVDYKAFKSIFTQSKHSADNYKFTIYDLYFQSSFWKQLKMVLIKN